MGDRAVYCARLESVCAERHPGFESPPIRHALHLGLTSRGRKGAQRFFCALLVFLVSGAGGETALQSSNLLETAKGDFRRGNFAGALALLDQLDKARSGNPESLDLRGTIYLEQGRFDEAKKAFRTASEGDPKRFLPRLHFGDVLLREKKFADARDIYDKLLGETDIQLSSEKLRYALLLTYLFEHDLVHAQRALERITFPTESPAYYYAQAAWEFAHNRRGDAIKWLKAADLMFDSKTIAWFARPLFDFGWTKEKPPLIVL